MRKTYRCCIGLAFVSLVVFSIMYIWNFPTTSVAAAPVRPAIVAPMHNYNISVNQHEFSHSELHTITEHNGKDVTPTKSKRDNTGKNSKSKNKVNISDNMLAQKILSQFKSRYPLLKNTSVKFGNAQGYQAVSYYSRGVILINRKHKASLKTILQHEIWHIIDYRDNHHIDWGESIPPKNSFQYVNKN